MPIYAKRQTVAEQSVVKPRVLPRIHPRIQRLLEQKDLLLSLVDGVGSPLNVIFPQNIEDNIKSFQDAYQKNHLRGRIYYTSKPCKSNALLRHASLFPIGLDVSSPNSLKEALGCGFAPDRIEATGPKNLDYLLTCLQLDVLLNVDNFEELKLIAALHKKLGLSRRARVFVRLCGFNSPRVSFTPQDNTFGIHVKNIPAVLDWLVEHKKQIDFQGFAFYVSGASNEQRLVAIENQLELTFLARKKGLQPKGIDIGGGFAIQYADSQEEWDEYQLALKQSVKNEIPSQTWNNSGLGYRNDDGVVAGGPLYFNHYSVRTKGDELDDLLNRRLPKLGNAKIASLISDNLLELYIEPGRAMLDQCGITLGRVNFNKPSTWDEQLVGVDMNQTNLRSMHHKNLTQSVVLYRNAARNKPNDEGLFYMGNLCVSYDILQYNKQFPDLTPQTDDVVCFLNTAPYAMDFNESTTLMQPIATKVAVWENNEKWNWALDNKYIPIDFSGLEK
jgi:diaminopimelate decarboxylase